MNRKCKCCGKIFDPKYKKQKYCSVACYRINQRTNSIEIKRDYAELILISKKYGRIVALIDIEDIDKIKQLQWRIDKVGKNRFYISTNLYGQTPSKLYLHRFITNCPSEKCVDHLNHNPLDNRKSNLRICTISENNNNFSLSKANKTGHKHICFDKRNNKYYLSIKGVFYGRFKTIEEALIKREEVYAKICSSHL